MKLINIDTDYGMGFCDGVQWAKNKINPVRHGYWIDHPKYMDHSLCSVCKADVKNKFNLRDAEYDYCPKCGAKMDGQKHE